MGHESKIGFVALLATLVAWSADVAAQQQNPPAGSDQQQGQPGAAQPPPSAPGTEPPPAPAPEPTRPSEPAAPPPAPVAPSPSAAAASGTTQGPLNAGASTSESATT